MTDLHVEVENGIFSVLQDAFARFMLAREALKLKASLLKLVDWQCVSPVCCFVIG
ncbi:MAG: hypothetical protein KBT32_00515 [Bacteroidales bacterium]|nr:hypothetical protein [Candidatus Physcocola equi]